jgi:hypothetical protein
MTPEEAVKAFLTVDPEQIPEDDGQSSEPPPGRE